MLWIWSDPNNQPCSGNFDSEIRVQRQSGFYAHVTACPGAEVYLTARADGRVTLRGPVRHKESVRSRNIEHRLGRQTSFGEANSEVHQCTLQRTFRLGCSRNVVTGVSLMAQMVKNLCAMQETRVQSLGWEDPPEGRAWQPTPIFLPGEFHGQRSLVGYGVAKSQTRPSG